MKKILYIIFILGLLFPLLQLSLGVPKILPLEGYFGPKKNETPTLSLDNWFSGNFQVPIESYNKKNCPSAPFYIRLRNQIDFSLFNIVNVNNVHKGKNNYIYYLTQYFIDGGKMLELTEMERKVENLKRIQDSLNTLGKKIVYVLAPEKLAIFPEYLPEKMPISSNTFYTYRNYLKLFSKHKINCIDFNAWFISLKDTASYPLFAKGGKHWAHYYATLAFDSIGDYLRADFKIPDFEYIKPYFTERPWKVDYDILNSANLLLDLDNIPLAQTEFKIQNFEGPQMLIFGDSYFHSIGWRSILKQQYSDSSNFWYYNKEMFDSDNKMIGTTSKDNFDRLANTTEIYLIMISLGNIDNFDFGALEYF
tara:strand:- start:293 stop:1384 length:1092 start_codon:yes stop_codon:yes gene_type:complete